MTIAVDNTSNRYEKSYTDGKGETLGITTIVNPPTTGVLWGNWITLTAPMRGVYS